MRVTNALLFNTSLRNYRSSSEKLYDINQQIASRMKIQNSYENTGVYVDAMRLNYEIGTLEQSSESSSKAKSFADNTDSALTDITEQFELFKTTLSQAANASNSTTSLEALANELEAIKDQIINLSNTSINGQFLFSGSAIATKAVSSDGTYNGNSQSLTSVIGSGVELPYNIDGTSLFLGTDSDYSKVISTNVSMLNQTKLHPDVMDNAGTDTTSSEVYLTSSDTIRDLVGDTDSDTTNDPNAVFYLSGRKSSGETFSTKIEMSSSSSVEDLLESIGTSYGNTSTNKVVNVAMNARGQIEVTDLKTGNQTLEMNLFGAVDRNATAGNSRNASQTDVNDLLAQSNVDIISFNASNYATTNTASTISSRADIYESDIYRIGYPLETTTGDTATSSTLLSDIMPSDVDNILVGGTSMAVTSTTTVQNLMSAIETEYGLTTGSVRIEDGQIIAESTASLNATLVARDGTTAASGFSIPDSINYTQRGFEKDGNELTSNVSQVIKSSNTYATASTKLSEVAGVSTLNGKSLTLDFTDIDGNSKTATINLSNAGSTFTVGTQTFSIYNGNGSTTSADDVTYKQVTDIMSMITSNTLPSSTTAADYNTAINSAKSSVEVSLNYKGQLNIVDKTASQSQIEFSMYDSDAGDYSGTTSTALSFMANDSVTIENPTIDMFAQLNEMIDAVRSGNFRMDSTSDDPRNMGIQNALSTLDHLADHVAKEHTKIGAYSNALSDAKEMTDTLKVNVETVQTEIVGVDITEAYLQYSQISTSFQAMLSAISKVNSMSLLDYM